MNRSKFILELEEWWINKYGDGWARGEACIEDLMEAAIDLEIKNAGIL